MSSGIGALLVPFPFAIDDHQTANGQFLVDHRAAEMIQQADLTNDQLASFITQIAIDTELRLEMAINARSLAQTNAASYVAHACEEIANE
jgi:UDP-N-acetylglucosamine--N-acetylmuramyl-(pentapeptide) pyrophosphoryl-undecaprenol N-acetylglucosamine transferase